MAEARLRFGMLGCAGIGKKFCVSTSEANNATLVAVASRSREKAEAYVAEHCPGAKAYGSYLELLEDPDVQAVYIPLPTVGRGEWVAKAAAKKKHVLCEKPLEGSLRDAQRMVAACAQAGVQFMDNTMFVHHDRQAAVKKAISDGGLVGPPKHVATAFSLPLGDDADWSKGNIRTKRDQEPLGCLGDLGWYCVRFTLFAFGYDDPEAVSCHFIEETDEGVPLKVVASMKFSGGRTATFDCSFKHPWRQWVEVSGAECTLSMDDFVIPGSMEASFTVSRTYPGDRDLFFPREVVKTETVGSCAQHVQLVEKFASVVLAGTTEDFWPTVSMQTQTVIAALVASARRQADWVQPRAPREAKLPEPRKASFVKVADVGPESKGLNLMVKVVSIKEGGGGAVLGDASGVVTLARRGDGAHDAVLKEGASLVVRNASARVVGGFLRLVVDRWGKLEPSPEPFAFEPKAGNDVSSAEYYEMSMVPAAFARTRR